MPLTLPEPASTPLSSGGCSSSSVPGSNSISSRTSGSRLAAAALSAAGLAAGGAGCLLSDGACVIWRSSVAVRLSMTVTLISSGGPGASCSGGTFGTEVNGSCSGEDERDVRAAESERVVDDGHRAVGAHSKLLRLHRDREPRVVIGVIQVDRGRRDLLAQGEDSRDRFDGARAAEQVAHHRLGR